MNKRIRSFIDNVELRIGKATGKHSTLILKGSFWGILGIGVSRLGLLFTSIIIARILGKDVFGEYSFIRTTILMFVVFGGDAIGLTASKFVAQYIAEELKEKLDQVVRFTFYMSLFLGSFFGAGMFFMAEIIAQSIFGDVYLVKEIQISSLIIVISSLNGSFQGVLLGRKRFKEVAVINVVTTIFTLVFQIFGVLWYGLIGAIAGYGLSLVVNLVLLVLRSGNEGGRISIIFKSSDFIQQKALFFKFSLPAAINGILIVPVAWIGNALLIKFVGTGALGVFSAALSWRNVVLIIPSIVAQVSLPFLSGLYSLSNHNDYFRVLKFNIWFNFLVSALIVGLVSIFSSQIMSMYGEGFKDGNQVLTVLLVSSILSSVNSVVGQALNSQGKIWLGVFFNFGWALVFIVVAYLCLSIWQLGSMSLALAYLISYGFHTVWQGAYVFSRRHR